MKFRIAEDTLLSSLKKSFHESFLFLKLEFFRNKQSGDSGYGKQDILDNSLKASDINPGIRPSEFEYDAGMTVKEFETQLSALLGFHVQVFRRSRNLFLETAMTDDWTLDQQNREGKLSVEGPIIDNTDMTDRDQSE